jgi:hypothetical protein
MDEAADRMDHEMDPGANRGGVAAASAISSLAATTEYGSAMNLGVYGMVWDAGKANPVCATLLLLHAQSMLEGGTANLEKGQTWELPGGPLKEMVKTNGATEILLERELGGKE